MHCLCLINSALGARIKKKKKKPQTWTQLTQYANKLLYTTKKKKISFTTIKDK